MPDRPPRLRPALLAAGLLPAAALAAELGVRAADSYTGGAWSRPPCPAAALVPCGVARHALPAYGTVAGLDPDSGEPRVVPLNSLGLRGGEVPIPKPRHEKRVLVLGDGAVFAAGVPAAETFCGRLVAPLTTAAVRAAPDAPETRAAVVNAGVPGDCPLLSVLRLRTLAAVQPDLIVLCVRPSDLAEDARYRRDLRTDAAGRPLACPHPALVGAPGVTVEVDPPWWKKSLAVRVAGQALTDRGACLAPPPAGDVRGALAAEQALAPLSDLARLADGLGVNAAVILLPERGRPADGFAADRPAAGSILAAAGAAKLRSCDAVAAFAAAGEGAGPLLTANGQFTRAGHAVLADTLLAFLIARPPVSSTTAGPGG